jgi:hypothetical protein
MREMLIVLSGPESQDMARRIGAKGVCCQDMILWL